MHGMKMIAVKIDTETYYACCDGCVQQLKTNTEVRYATDPYSLRKVDKANAYIVLDPSDSNSTKILYFENEDNFLNYNEKKK